MDNPNCALGKGNNCECEKWGYQENAEQIQQFWAKGAILLNCAEIDFLNRFKILMHTQDGPDIENTSVGICQTSKPFQRFSESLKILKGSLVVLSLVFTKWPVVLPHPTILALRRRATSIWWKPHAWVVWVMKYDFYVVKPCGIYIYVCLHIKGDIMHIYNLYVWQFPTYSPFTEWKEVCWWLIWLTDKQI